MCQFDFQCSTLFTHGEQEILVHLREVVGSRALPATKIAFELGWSTLVHAGPGALRGSNRFELSDAFRLPSVATSLRECRTTKTLTTPDLPISL
jgi:hypothetical protein